MQSFLLSAYRYNITIPAIKGCARIVKVDNQHAKYLEVVGVSKGCPTDLLVRNLDILHSLLFPTHPPFYRTWCYAVPVY